MAWAVAVLIAAVAFAISPALTSGFAGFSSDQFPVSADHWPAQPAGWAFSIWGVIYLWLVVSAVFGIARRATDPRWQVTRPALTVSLVVGVFWIAVANTSPVLAVFMILIMAASASVALLQSPSADRLWLEGPVGLYAGWLTAASGVAIAVVISGYGLLGGQLAAAPALISVTAIALAVQARRPQIWSYALAVGWSLVGVIAANLRADSWPVATLALGALALLGWRYWALNRHRDRPYHSTR